MDLVKSKYTNPMVLNAVMREKQKGVFMSSSCRGTVTRPHYTSTTQHYDEHSFLGIIKFKKNKDAKDVILEARVTKAVCATAEKKFLFNGTWELS